MITRRRFVRNASVVSAALAVAPKRPLALAQAVTGTYHNPIMGGDHPDASPIRVGDDFYLTHSSFDYAPGLLIWHSRDLINWRPLAAALHSYHGSVWAPYLCEYPTNLGSAHRNPPRSRGCITTYWTGFLMYGPLSTHAAPAKPHCAISDIGRK